MECTVLQTADTLIVTSPSTQREFQAKTSRPIEVITNGYDDDFPTQTPSLSPYFLLSHIGSLLSERNPEPLWQVLSEMTKEQPDFRRDLRLCLAGKVSDEVLTSLQKWQLLPCNDNPNFCSSWRSTTPRQKVLSQASSLNIWPPSDLYSLWAISNGM